LFAFLIGPLLGFAVLILIKIRKDGVVGQKRAIASIAIGFIWFFFLWPGVCLTRSGIQRLQCEKNYQIIFKAFEDYASDNSGKLPEAEKWCDLIINYVEPEVFYCPRASDVRCSYAFNEKLKGLNFADLTDDRVLLFETDGGWNQIGGPELCSIENHGQAGSNILFCNGHVKLIWVDWAEWQNPNFKDLKW
jgi:hypothetical protein